MLLETTAVVTDILKYCCSCGQLPQRLCVKALALRAGEERNTGMAPHLPGLGHTMVVTRPDDWQYRANARTGRHGVNRL